VRRRLAFALALAVSATASVASVVEIAWDADGRFTTEQTVEPGGIAEVCGPVAAGQAVRWRFEADAPVDFNIHFHAGAKVHYPARQANVVQRSGTLKATGAQDYCWMWTKRGAKPTQVRLRLER
jgi:hypothetical protein